jgi:predicted ester cyclase
MTTTLDARASAIESLHAMATGTRADLVRLIHPEAVNREAGDEPPAASTPGPDGFWATALWLRAAFADLAFEVHEVVVDGDFVVIHNTMSGRQTGDMVMYAGGKVVQVMPPTGRRFASTQTHWLRMRDGQVFEHWANRDDIGTAQQLGWVPPTPLFLLRAWRAKRRHQRTE